MKAAQLTQYNKKNISLTLTQVENLRFPPTTF